MMAKKFSFPHDTCEDGQENQFPTQPVSFFINILSIMMIIFFIFLTCSKDIAKRDKIYIFGFLTTLLAFQSWHAFSHFMHLQSDKFKHIQAYVAHFLLYCIMIASVFIIPQLAGVMNYLSADRHLWRIIFIFLILIDFAILYNLKGLYMILSGFGLMGFVYLTHFHMIPVSIRKYFYFIFGLTFVLVVLEFTEMAFCDRLQSWMSFPYHMLIESVGMIALGLLSYAYIKWGEIKGIKNKV